VDIIISIVAPVFGVLLLGYLAARCGWFDAAAIRGLSLFVFNFAIPPLLFRNMANTQLPAELPWNLLFTYFLSTFSIFAVGMLSSGVLFARRLAEQGLSGFNAAFSNAVLLGIPLVLTTFGEDASLPLFLIIAFHSPLLLPVVTVIIEISRGSRASLRQIPLNTVKGLAKNPIIGGLLLGGMFNILQLQLPVAIDKIAQIMSQAALPCALFAMGASLSQYRIAGNFAEALTLVSLKLLLHPLLTWLLAQFVFQLPPLWTHTLVILAALPTGVNTYLFAQRYQVGITTSTTTIFISTALSMLSLSLILLLLQVR
jgi:predicted permease